MKKFRMMLPMLAFVFAVVGAIAGDFLPGITAYYKIGSNCQQTTSVTEQPTCAINLPTSRPVCTVNISGSHLTAYNDFQCNDVLRIPQ